MLKYFEEPSSDTSNTDFSVVIVSTPPTHSLPPEPFTAALSDEFGSLSFHVIITLYQSYSHCATVCAYESAANFTVAGISLMMPAFTSLLIFTPVTVFS